MTHAVGERVGVLTEEGIALGTYNGDLPCDLLGGRPNPNIKLDTGETVWGCQVWWGPEAKIRAFVASMRDAEDEEN